MKKATMPSTATPPATLNPTMVDVDTPESSLLLSEAAVLLEVAVPAVAVGVSDTIWMMVSPAALVVVSEDGVGVGVLDAGAVLEAGAVVGPLEAGDDDAGEELGVDEEAGLVVVVVVVEGAAVGVELGEVVVPAGVVLVVVGLGVALVAAAGVVDTAGADGVLESSPSPNIPARLSALSTSRR